MKTAEDDFDDLAQEVSRLAAKVQCSAEDYRAGLRAIIEVLKVDIRASEETSGGDDD
jgi:hypothetical protein